MTALVKKLCVIYNRDYDQGVTEIYMEYAKEDVEKRTLTWRLFFKSFRECGKMCKFFPTYADIREKANSLKESLRYETVPESHQLDTDSKASREKAKGYMSEYLDKHRRLSESKGVK